MQNEEFSFFDDDQQIENLVSDEIEHEEIRFEDILFWCKGCKTPRRWDECPKLVVN